VLLHPLHQDLIGASSPPVLSTLTGLPFQWFFSDSQCVSLWPVTPFRLRSG
jgi:hypothetical protein